MGANPLQGNEEKSEYPEEKLCTPPKKQKQNPTSFLI